jgi:hypothetical protein
MSRSTPTLRRRYLSAELKRLRITAGVSAGQAAEALGCSTDKIHWIERAGWSHPKWRDVRDLLDAYAVTDERKRDELIALARESRGKDWWQPYSRKLSKKYTAYIGLEADASSVLTFELCVVPGLLQTEDYARATIKAGPAELTAHEVDQCVAVRMERQRIFLEGSRRLRAVVDEAALRRPVGGPNVMRAQVKHLIKLADHPKITLRVVPFSAGPYPSTTGSFTLLSFAEGSSTAVYAETVGGEVLLEDPMEIAGYERVFHRLDAMALTPEDTITALTAQR